MYTVEKQVYHLKKENGELPTPFLKAVNPSMLNFLNSAKQFSRKKQNDVLHRTLRLSSKDDSIKVNKFDKGNGLLIINNQDYYNKLYDIVLDGAKFTDIRVDESKVHPIISKENPIVRFLKKSQTPAPCQCIEKYNTIR